MHLKQEVSTLDFADGVTLNGFTIPALSTRRAETDVELGEGQSFVVAGLVNNQETEYVSTRSRCWAAFRSSARCSSPRTRRNQRTDLVVMVTPEDHRAAGAERSQAEHLHAQGFPGAVWIPRICRSRRQSKGKKQVRELNGSTGGFRGRADLNMSARVQNEAEITALLIAPNRELAQQFLATLPQTRAFQILADLKSYPPQQTLEIRARQLKPHVVLLDLATRSERPPRN